ncbi:antitoxin Xre/MbcA/ParS toxin-binding domain-containing protein [Kineococcus aurantiacus]|uniref:DUF2384 domain-containing protein n=1 Tax=Kineococcus aurantiacus TaxID=37633 RepID=A0A7Y9DQY0_9ACTN|nr:antitoxin Xre/MbcA/ParS toxin-binding domain-containing protein [Kineococcus aurantiacus]NYD25048.1 hypothetical protein [Kineococcus aurantiacus]
MTIKLRASKAALSSRHLDSKSGRHVIEMGRSHRLGPRPSKLLERVQRNQQGARITFWGPKGVSIRKVPAEHLEMLVKTVDELGLRDPRGRNLRRLKDVEGTARRAARVVVDTAAAWEDHLGPFYDVDGVRELLGGDQPISRQAVSKRRSLLALRTGSGQVVYPVFQFLEETPLPGLGAALEELPEQLVSRWTVASWLVSPQPELGGVTPVDLLRDGNLVPVVKAARSWARALAA